MKVWNGFDFNFCFVFLKNESIPFFKLYGFLSDQTGRSRPAAGLNLERRTLNPEPSDPTKAG